MVRPGHGPKPTSASDCSGARHLPRLPCEQLLNFLTPNSQCPLHPERKWPAKLVVHLRTPHPPHAWLVCSQRLLQRRVLVAEQEEWCPHLGQELWTLNLPPIHPRELAARQLPCHQQLMPNAMLGPSSLAPPLSLASTPSSGCVGCCRAPATILP